MVFVLQPRRSASPRPETETQYRSCVGEAEGVHNDAAPASPIFEIHPGCLIALLCQLHAAEARM